MPVTRTVEINTVNNYLNLEGNAEGVFPLKLPEGMERGKKTWGGEGL
jgi:hypothetical protein